MYHHAIERAISPPTLAASHTQVARTDQVVEKDWCPTILLPHSVTACDMATAACNLDIPAPPTLDGDALDPIGGGGALRSAARKGCPKSLAVTHHQLAFMLATEHTARSSQHVRRVVARAYNSDTID
ncbi:hypothetical protein [Nocardia xishanensis]